MVRNNHLNDNRALLNELLRGDTSASERDSFADVIDYARHLADVENLLVVVSDMVMGNSHIISGAFSRNLDLGSYRQECSIWESKILSLMSREEQEEKYLAELHFFHYLRKLPKNKRQDYYLVSKLRFLFADGNIHNVLHRMYYIWDNKIENIRYAICTYGPLPFDLPGKSFAVNSITGVTENLTDTDNAYILSARERQVLSMIDSGMISAEIAHHLNISIHTVSRHRQEIISKLQVKNTHEACRIAKSLNLI